MRTVLIYMLSLALLLLGGYHYVNGAANHRRHPVRFIISSEKFKFAKSEQQAHLVSTVSGDDKQAVFNVEDEDEDLVFNRKFLQLTGYFVTLFYAAFLLYSLKNLKRRLLIERRLNYTGPQRYILQGAMLI